MAKKLEQIVCIQLIRTDWTKLSRGGSAAVARNRIPEATRFTLPHMSSAFLVHQSFYGEHAGFQASYLNHTESHDGNSLLLENLRVRHESKTLSVIYQYDRSQGMPERHSAPITALTLEPEQWGRICYNGRFSGYSTDWRYRKWVWNIGLFADPKPNAFLTTPPVRVFSQMAILF